MGLLSFLIFFPLIGAVLGFVIRPKSIKIFAIIVSLIEFLASIYLWYSYEPNTTKIQFIEHYSLIKDYGISYFVGIDAISIFMIILSAFMSLIAIISLTIDKKPNNLIASILVLETTMIGVFSALDGILFYIFWEFSLVPMLYIIGFWGSGNKIYAAVKFFIYTFSASLIMLFGLLFLAWLYKDTSGVWSFSLLDWYRLQIPMPYQIAIFVALGIGFAVKVPMFPFHTWLPYAHGQAPTIGSVLLAAVLLKMGTYAFIRFSLPILPDASVYLMIPMAIIGLIMVVYAAMVAFAQTDMKQVIAYSSISHMGIIIIGIFALNVEGISGAIFFMLSHGIISGGLFILVGVIYERKHTKEISAFGGLAKVMPKYAAIFSLVLMGSVGLPLTMGFVGEFLSILGFFRTSPIIAAVAGLSIIVGAIYMLYLYKRSFFGELKQENANLKDLSLKELSALLPLAVVIIWLGIYPKPILAPLQTTVSSMINLMYAKSKLDTTKQILKNANITQKGLQ